MLGRRNAAMCCALALSAICRLASSHHQPVEPPGLAVREEESRVVLSWTGPVAETMPDAFKAALARYVRDPRVVVVTLDSPGGSVEQGHRVMAAIRAAAQWHRIDTRVERGAICASMCVPIYLLGTERTADPEARFMFHEARILLPIVAEGHAAQTLPDPRSRKAAETFVTDLLYEADVGGARVSPTWLRAMRARIVGHDVWADARQLVAERAGVVDTLTVADAR